MNIVHMADVLVIGGLETYIATLLNKLAEDKNNNVHLMVQRIALEMRNLLSPDVKVFEKSYSKETADEYIDYIKLNKIEIINSHPHVSLENSIEIKNKLNLPVVFTYHGLYGWLNSSYEKIEKLIAVSNEIQHLLKDKPELNNKIEVIQSGIDSEKIFKKEEDVIEKKKVVLFVGRIDADKLFAIKKIVEAIKNMDEDVLLKIAGAGNFYDALKEYVKNEKVENIVELYGYVSEMNEVLNKADIIISTGRGIKEAMLCGKPCISLDCNSYDGIVHKESIDDLEYANFSGRGKRSAIFNIEFIKRDLKILLDENKRKEIGEWSRIYALENYTSDVFVNKHLNIYKNILKI